MKPSLPHANRIWVAVRFVIFGAGGLGLLFYSGIHLFLRITEQSPKHTLDPLIATGLLVIASLSILYGIGRWGRWLYLPALIVCPFIFLALLFGFAARAPHSDKSGGLLFVAAAMVLSFSGLWLVDLYYRRRGKIDKDRVVVPDLSVGETIKGHANKPELHRGEDGPPGPTSVHRGEP
jgi:hypothetical protein